VFPSQQGSNPLAASETRLPDRAPSPESIALTELDLMCRACLDSWNGLVQTVATTGHLLSSQPETQSWSRWAHVDRLLGLVNRIDRILTPPRGKDSAESYKFRMALADRLRTFTGGLTLSENDVAEVRNVVEHSDEYLLEFVQSNPDKRLAALVIATTEDAELDPHCAAIRYLDPFSGVCLVLGRRVNLRALVDRIRELKLALPAKKLTMEVRIADDGGI
jgi:hypothetical protein